VSSRRKQTWSCSSSMGCVETCT